MRSLTEIAYEILDERKIANKEVPYNFYDLWKKVCEVAGLPEEDESNRISSFYTQLILDGRFVTLGENTWDLRIRHTFDKVHIDMNDIYAEEDDVIDEDEDEIDDELVDDDEEDDDDKEDDETETTAVVIDEVDVAVDEDEYQKVIIV